MARVVQLNVDFDTEDWVSGDIWVPDGVLAGYVALSIRGRRILKCRPSGLNNSAVALVRSALAPHVAATEQDCLYDS